MEELRCFGNRHYNETVCLGQQRTWQRQTKNSTGLRLRIVQGRLGVGSENRDGHGGGLYATVQDLEFDGLTVQETRQFGQGGLKSNEEVDGRVFTRILKGGQLLLCPSAPPD